MDTRLHKFHNTVLDIHEKKLYSSVLRQEHITTTRKMISFKTVNNQPTERLEGFFATKGDQRYFLSQTLYDALPIKINHEDVSKLIDNDNNLVYRPNEVASFRVKPDNCFDRYEFISDFFPVEHSNPEIFNMFKELCIACEIGKIGLCISSEKGFGKTNIFKMIGHLGDQTHVIPTGTYKGMLSRVNGKGCLVVDEIIDLDTDKRKALKKITLNLLGADDNIKNEALRSSGTKDEWNTRDQSFVMLYNLIEDIHNNIYNFFDGLIADHPAIMDRVLKVRFTGMITTVWEKNFNLEDCAEENMDYYIKVAKYIEYLRALLRSGQYQYRYTYDWKYGLTSRRSQMLMDIKFVFDYFSQTQEQFEKKMKLLEDSMIEYDTFINIAKEKSNGNK